ncbi:MAG: hypothetical protein HRU46_03920 [Verrucomicrobiales bacterium]|nr:hypothetical protein [Verrucomicrobiales bacterium]
MKRLVWFGIGVSFLTAAGNAQDGAETAAVTSSPGVYTTQGSAAYNQTLRDAEQRRRVDEARQMKAIKDSMRTVNPSAVKYTTAEQFLAANRPPMPPATDPAEQERIRRDSYVPDFQAPSSAPQARGGYTAPPPVDYPRVETELPEKRNFFKWLGSQNSRNQPPGEIDRVIHEAQQSVPQNAPVIEAVPPVSQSPDLPESNSGGFLGKFFGGKKAAEPEAPQLFEAPVEAADQPPADTMAPANEGGGLPEPPEFADTPSAPASSGPAPIFVSPESASGTPMTVRQTTQAEVGGVRVVLYEGSRVNLLSRSGNTANIQLPDGRKGTTELNSLQ